MIDADAFDHGKFSRSFLARFEAKIWKSGANKADHAESVNDVPELLA